MYYCLDVRLRYYYMLISILKPVEIKSLLSHFRLHSVTECVVHETLAEVNVAYSLYKLSFNQAEYTKTAICKDAAEDALGFFDKHTRTLSKVVWHVDKYFSSCLYFIDLYLGLGRGVNNASLGFFR